MTWSKNLWVRKIHRSAAIVAFLPMSIVIVTGILLLLKKHIAWIQPPTIEGTSFEPNISFDQVLNVCRSIGQTDVDTWNDIDRLDVRPSDGIVKVTCENRMEVQIDLGTAEVLSVKYRRSDLIESMHDGTFFHDAAKLSIFLPNGILLAVLWCTGVYLWVLPRWVRARKRRQKMSMSQDARHHF